MQRRDFFSLPSLAAGMLLPHAGPFDGAPPSHVYNVLDYGAVADGRTLNTVAIQSAIDKAFRMGGGTIYVPPGKFLLGGIVLQSHVTLYLEGGATLLGSIHFEDYAPQPGPSSEGDANSHHLIFARNAESICITGLGTIDGQGQAYWTKSDRSQPAAEDLWADVIQFDWKATPRRPAPMLEFAYCKNVRVEGITLRNAPSWTMRPVACESVFIRGVRIRNPIYGPNTDGLDITSSRNVIVSDCDIECGDDAICIKSENPYGANLPTKNITITNCVLSTCCNGLKIGTSTNGRIENIVFSNSLIVNDDVPLNERVIAGLAVEMVDGGGLDGVLVSNIRMKNVRTPIFVRLGERHGGRQSFLRNIVIRGVNAVGAIYPSSITGLPSHPVQGITLTDITIQTEEEGKAAWANNIVPECANSYPEARMFGRLPSSGLYIRHAQRVRLADVEFIADDKEERPALACDDVEDFSVFAFRAQAPASDQPIICLNDVRNAFIHGSHLGHPRSFPLRVSGENSADIVSSGNHLRGADGAVQFSQGARESSVTVQ